MWWWFFHGFPHSPMEFNRDVYRAEPLCSEVGLYMHGSTIFLNHRPNDLAPCLQWTDRTSKSSGWNHHEMTMKWTRNGGHTSISHGHMENDRKVEIRYQNRTGYVCTVYIYICTYIYCFYIPMWFVVLSVEESSRFDGPGRSGSDCHHGWSQKAHW